MTDLATDITGARYSRDDLLSGPLAASGAVGVLEELRDGAAERGDLADTLLLDNALENNGVHADSRLTCYSCQDWADHRHKLSGARIPATVTD